MSSCRRWSNSPYWITTAYGGKCFQCELGIKKGETALYYPGEKRLLCQREPCGQRAEREMKERHIEKVLYGISS